MAKKQKETKEVKVAPELVALGSCLSNTIESLKNSREAAKRIVGCPKKIIDRLTSMKITVEKSTNNIVKQLGNLEAKAVRIEATAVRKIAHLEKMKAQAAKLAARIAAAEAK